MEFSSVIVCGFGEYFVQEFGDRDLDLRNFPAGTRNLKLEYFLNKLYVAVSRSTKVLGIIDTERGDRRLWKAASQGKIDHWFNTLSAIDQSQTWRQQIEAVQDTFNINVFRQGNPLELSQSFMREGLDQKNRRFLETAAYYYERAQQPAEMEYCRTWLLRLDGDLLEAEKRFIEIQGLTDRSLNPPQDAWECFWEGKHWQEILLWCDRYPQATESKWRSVASFIEKVIVATDNPPYDDKRWLAWQQILSTLAKAGFAHDQNLALAACCAYQARRYSDAISLWEQCKEESHREHNKYFLSKAEASPAPKNISWFSRAQQTKRIVEVWQKENHKITEEWYPVLKDLCRALEQHEQYKDLLEINIQLSQWVQAIQRFNSRIKAQDPEFDAALRLATLNRMANDQTLNAEAIESEANQELLCQFVTETTKLQEWEADQNTIQEVSEVFARIGEFPALEFYERFRNSATKEICELAREKWIEVKHKQASYSEQMGKLDLAQRQRQEAAQAIGDWQYSPATAPPTTISSQQQNDSSIDALRQQLFALLENLSENELNQVHHYIRFLEFQRHSN
jgi:hypothetical protein